MIVLIFALAIDCPKTGGKKSCSYTRCGSGMCPLLHGVQNWRIYNKLEHEKSTFSVYKAEIFLGGGGVLYETLTSVKAQSSCFRVYMNMYEHVCLCTHV